MEDHVMIQTLQLYLCSQCIDTVEEFGSTHDLSLNYSAEDIRSALTERLKQDSIIRLIVLFTTTSDTCSDYSSSDEHHPFSQTSGLHFEKRPLVVMKRVK